MPNNSFESFAPLTGTGRLRRPAPQLKRKLQINMYISIKKNYQTVFLLDIANLKYIHASGMPNGSIWIHGASDAIDGMYKSVNWNEIQIKSHDTISVCLIEDGIPSDPTCVEERTLSSLKEILSEIINRDEEGSEFTKIDVNNDSPIKLLMKVFESGKEIFSFTGTHVQFDISWKKEESPTILFWSSNERDYTANEKVIKSITEKDIVIRFSS